jgi:hypothetical protein
VTAVTPESVDAILAGLSFVDAFDSNNLPDIALLLDTYTAQELLVGVVGVASILRKAVAAEAACPLPMVTAQVRDDILHAASLA